MELDVRLNIVQVDATFAHEQHTPSKNSNVYTLRLIALLVRYLKMPRPMYRVSHISHSETGQRILDGIPLTFSVTFGTPCTYEKV